MSSNEVLHLLSTQINGQTLDLYKKNISPGLAAKIVKYLINNESITKLDLFGNNLGEEGAKYIAELLKWNKTITFLNLSSNNIKDSGVKYIAEALKVNSSLIQLEFFNNNIETRGFNDLCDAFMVNKSVKKLNLGRNVLNYESCFWISELISNNKTIESLSLSHCNIADDVQIYIKLAGSKIKQLDLEANNITLFGFTNLFENLLKSRITVLSLKSNNITTLVSESLAKFLTNSNTLTCIDLSDCSLSLKAIELISNSLKSNQVLKSLNLSNNKIKLQEIKYISQLIIFNRHITSLDLSNNKIDSECAIELAKALEFNITLENLCLYNNEIDTNRFKEFVISLSNNYTLRSIDLDNNKPVSEIEKAAIKLIMKRNEDIQKNANQCKYYLSKKTDIQFCNEFNQLIGKNITKLILSYMDLTKFPKQILELKALKFLDLRGNHIYLIPNEIDSLKSLIELHLSHNDLDFLPFSLIRLSSLKILTVHHNPLRFIPDIYLNWDKIICNQFHETPLFRYLQLISTVTNAKETKFCRAKLMVVGDEKVGKTSLVQNLSGKKEKRLTLKSNKTKTYGIATDGIKISEYQQKTRNYVSISENVISWDIWDFAGQEVYYTTHPFFISPNTVYLVCYNAQKCDDYQISRIEYWIKSIQTRAGKLDTYIFLVATHSDKISSEERQNNIKKLEHLCQASVVLGLIFLSNNNKKREGFRELKEKISATAVKYKLIGHEYPNSINEIQNILKLQKAPYTSKQSLKALISGMMISNEKVKDVIYFLGQIGTIIHFGKEEKLKDIVFIKPQFLCDTFSDIITVRHSIVKNGILKSNDAELVWQDDRKLFTTSALLKLYEMFDIAVQLDNDTYLIPSLLSDVKPDVKLPPLPSDMQISEYYRVYQFKFLPFGFFPRLMTRCFKMTGFKVLSRWKHGIILDLNGERAFILFDDLNYRLDIKIEGKSPSLLLITLTKCVDDLIKGWYWNAEYDVFISYYHKKSVYTVNQKQILILISKGEKYYSFDSNLNISLDQLCPDLCLSNIYTLRINKRDIKYLESIGKGGYGEVYRAMYKNELVAVKSYDVKAKKHTPNDFESYEEYERFINERIILSHQDLLHEIYIISTLQCDYIVKLKGFSFDPPKMLMEYLPNGDLDRYLTKNDNDTCTLSVSLRYRIAQDVAKGMAFMNSCNPPICHRDLSSNNVMIASMDPNADVVAKIIDFSTATPLVGNTLGVYFNEKKYCLAPEVLSQQNYTHKCDVYSYGILLWQLMTGKYNHGISELDIRRGVRPSLPPVSKHYPSMYHKLVMDCWDQNPNKRPEFKEIVTRLEKIMAELD